jgi:hypothetical protein
MKGGEYMEYQTQTIIEAIAEGVTTDEEGRKLINEVIDLSIKIRSIQSKLQEKRMEKMKTLAPTEGMNVARPY